MVYIGIDFDRDAGHILTARFAKFSDAGFLVILIPLVLMAFLGGRVLFHYNDKFSFFNTFVVAATSTIISLPFSMIFPWQAVIEEGSIIRVNPNISAITSTLIIQYLLVSVVFLFCSLLNKNK
ncbi:hypothetical protein [Lacticaseibacillus rhamnosus]|uniref:hypothetical protein n=1 Tax=Lacticaseibacillus rhamnosus TaxID=47715 RepID=UPI00215C30DC|nr:hypothetical protein [Lacticaseibacillus rhamnosus]